MVGSLKNRVAKVSTSNFPSKIFSKSHHYDSVQNTL